MTILVTGGAGYVGSHTVRAMLEAGYQVVVADNLSTGFRAAVPAACRFYEGDIRDAAFLARLFEQENIDGVIHFAAFSQVGESGKLRFSPSCTLKRLYYWALSRFFERRTPMLHLFAT